jgi:hypothetical protein
MFFPRISHVGEEERSLGGLAVTSVMIDKKNVGITRMRTGVVIQIGEIVGITDPEE